MRILLGSIALVMACTAPAAAQPVDNNYHVAVSYADLNVRHPAGLAAFKGRVKAMAVQACDVPPITLGQVIDVRKCRANFVRTAERDIELELATTSDGRVFAGR